MSTTQSTASATNTVIGVWHSSTPAASSSSLDLEAQVVIGHRELVPPPASARTHAPHTQAGAREGTDPIDDFFGAMRGTQDSRHDDRRSSMHYDEDAPPPYADASGLPSYASVAEPPTLAMYLFKFGFCE